MKLALYTFGQFAARSEDAVNQGFHDRNDPVLAFTYGGLHREALAKGRDWFRKGDWPPLVLWWTQTQPDWAEGVRRYDHLCAQGPSARAFGFGQAYDATGVAYVLDRARVRLIRGDRA